MNKLSIYIYFIIFLKLIFMILTITNLYKKIKHQENTESFKTINFWKHRIEFVFVALMSGLLIYIFNPTANRINLINYEVKLLFYLFGFILLITAKWDIFFDESIMFNRIQKILGEK